MGLNSFSSLITDQYERAARLYPALLALLPILIALAVTSVFGKPLATQLLTLFGACGAAYLLANISRMLGKAKEERLFAKWGGTPTTQLLRHRNEFIDPHTKQRYHAFLARRIKIAFPTRDDEYASPDAADEIYKAGVKWLLGKDPRQKALRSAVQGKHFLWLPPQWLRTQMVWRTDRATLGCMAGNRLSGIRPTNMAGTPGRANRNDGHRVRYRIGLGCLLQ